MCQLKAKPQVDDLPTRGGHATSRPIASGSVSSHCSSRQSGISLSRRGSQKRRSGARSNSMACMKQSRSSRASRMSEPRSVASRRSISSTVAHAPFGATANASRSHLPLSMSGCPCLLRCLSHSSMSS